MRKAFEAKQPDDSGSEVRPFHPQVTVPLQLRVSQLAFTADEQFLIVCAEAGGGLAVYNVDSLNQGVTQPAFEINTNGEAVRALVPNPASELAGFCAIVTDKGNLLMANLNDKQLVSGSNGPVLRPQVSCAAWSTKGKQLVAGMADGTLHQMTPDGTDKGKIPKPSGLGDFYVSTATWLENNVFLVIHAAANGQDPSAYHLITREQTPGAAPNFVFQKMTDPVEPFGSEKVPHHTVLRMRDFAPSLQDLLIVSSTATESIGLLTRSKTPLASDKPAEAIANVFTTTELADDSKRAQLPMSEDMIETFAIGTVLDLSSKDKVFKPIPSDETEFSPGPLPGLWVLNNEGVLSSWWIVYNDSIRSGTTYSGLAVLSGEAPASPARHAPTAVPTGAPAFGTPAGTASAFGSTTTTSQSVAPAFGGTSALGAKPSPWSTTSGAAAAPSFGTSSFGNAPAGAASPSFASSTFGSPSPFGGKPAAPAFGQASTMGIGIRASPWAKASSPTAAPAFGQSGFGSAAQTQATPANTGKVFGSGSGTGGFAGFASKGGFGSIGATSETPNIFASKSSGGFGSVSAGVRKESETSFPSLANKNLDQHGLGSSPFVLGTTFKAESLPADENQPPKESTGGGSMFGSGFGLSLSDAPSQPAAPESKDEDMDAATPVEPTPKTTLGLPSTTPTSTPATQKFGIPAISGPAAPTNLFAAKPAPSSTGASNPFGPKTSAVTGGSTNIFATKPGPVSTDSSSIFGPRPPPPAPGTTTSIFAARPAAPPSDSSSIFGSKTAVSGGSPNIFAPKSGTVSTGSSSFFGSKPTPPPSGGSPGLFGLGKPTAPDAAKSSPFGQPAIKQEPEEDKENLASIPQAPLPPDATSKAAYPLGDSSSSSGSSFSPDAVTKTTGGDAPLPPDFLGKSKPSLPLGLPSKPKSQPEDAPLPPDFMPKRSSQAPPIVPEVPESPEEGELSEEDVSDDDVDEEVEEEEEEEEEEGEEEEEEEEDEEGFEEGASEGSGVDVAKDLSPTATGLGSQTPGFTPQSSFDMAGSAFSTISRPDAQAGRSLFGEVSRNAPPLFPKHVPPSPRSPSPVRGPNPRANALKFGESQRSVSAPGMASQLLGQKGFQPPAKFGMSNTSRATPVVDPNVEEQRKLAAKRAAEAQVLQDPEDEGVQLLLHSKVEPTLRMDEFLAVDSKLEALKSTGRDQIPDACEALWRDINRMVDRLGLNSRSLQGFVLGHTTQFKPGGRAQADLEHADDWILVEAEELGMVVENELAQDLDDGRVKDIEATEAAIQNIARDLAKLRTKEEDMRKIVMSQVDPDQVAVAKSMALSAEQAAQQNELRRAYATFSKLLAETEEALTLLRAKVVSAGGASSKAAVPTVEAVLRTINKMTSMAEKRSGDIDVLENQMRRLRFSSAGLGPSSPGPRSREGSPFVASTSTPQRRSLMSPERLRDSFSSSAGGRATPPRKKPSMYSEEEKKTVRAKEARRKGIFQLLRDRLERAGPNVSRLTDDDA